MRVLVVHSSAELYGSDRSLLDFVRSASTSMAISVVLPDAGPLVAELEAAGATVRVDEVCKVQRSMLSLRGSLLALRSAGAAIKAMRRIAASDGVVDVVYSNTMATLGGALFARLHGIPHVWHVREIVHGSARLTSVFRLLARLFARRLICNSNETMRWIANDATTSRCAVVWNGVGVARPQGRRDAERARLGFGASDVVFVLAGRINGWKGQTLLVSAFELLRAEGISGIKLWMVGSAFAGQEHYESALRERIGSSVYNVDMVLEPFRPDIDAVWEAADVVTVPSTDPEPFGRVAIEAMAFRKPVIAAAHGGLLDIVENGVSGLLFEPRSPAALAAAMRELLRDSGRREAMGSAAQVRQQGVFSVEAYAMRVEKILRSAAGRPVQVAV